MVLPLLIVFFISPCQSVNGESNDCVDVDTDYCLRNEWLCHNEVFKKRMMRFCRKTCGFCHLPTLPPITKKTPKKCEDRKEEYCIRNQFLCNKDGFKEWMKVNCMRTCGYCDRTTEQPTPTQPKPTNPTTKPVTRVTVKTTTKKGKTHPPFKGECGKPKIKGTRIIAGTTPHRGAWPWQALLEYGPFPMCGGTLVHPLWIVTAAHCVWKKESSPGYFKMTLGDHDRRHHEGSEISIRGDTIIIHPEWDHDTRNNDVALIKLRKPVRLGKYIQPACLPSTDPPIGAKCFITGWGKTHNPGSMVNVLQQGILPVVSNKVCDQKNRNVTHIPITDSMICGGSGGKDKVSGCHGDSGGPYVCQINGRWELHGSVSHGSPNCDTNEAYTVFSRTNKFKTWIKHTIARN